MIEAKHENIKTSYGVYLKCYLQCLIQRHLTRAREFEEAEEKKLLTTTGLLSSLLELQQIEADLQTAMPKSAYLVNPLLSKLQKQLSELGSPSPPYLEKRRPPYMSESDIDSNLPAVLDIERNNGNPPLSDNMGNPDIETQEAGLNPSNLD